MIHDFAKLPRTYELHAPVSQRGRPRLRRRYVLALVLVLAAAVIVWHQFEAGPVVPSEFHPGQSESKDYQTAMAEEKADDVSLRVPKSAVKSLQLSAAATTTRHAKVVAPTVAKPAMVKPKFGFYDSLTHSTWSVPVQRGVYVSDADRKRMANQRFMLQAASVREVSDAQRLVQRLREAGLAASYTSSEQNGWNRVNVGPFENVSMMNKAEDILVHLGMMPIIRKIP